MNDRVARLRQRSLDAVPTLSLERAQLVTEAYKKYEGSVSIPVLRALTFKYLMENKTIYIGEDELIVGERGPEPKACPNYPELCCHTIQDLQYMNDREKQFFKVDEESKDIQAKDIIPFWEKRSIRHKIMDQMTTEWKEAYAAGMFTEFMEQRCPGHTSADGKMYKKGFLEFKEDINKALAELDFYNDTEAYNKQEELEAMAICCDAIIIFANRHAKKAKELAAKEANTVRKAELEKIAEVCNRIPANAPQNFWEALQMYWFVHVSVITELNTWDSFNPGRLDQHINPFYQKDIAEGTLTKDEALELLECFWVKFNNHPAPPKVGVTLNESGTYTDFANINSGGLTIDGADGVNDISYLVLKVIHEMRLLQPSTNIQLSKKNPDRFLKKTLEVVREGMGFPSIFNADSVIQEILRAGKTIEDARCGGTSGCVETGAFGKEAYILTGYLNLVKILEITLHNGVDVMTQKKLGFETGDPRDFKSIDDLMEAFKKQVNHFVDIKVRGNNVIEKLYMDYMPSPFLSIITDDCIKKGKDYNGGGARYNTQYIQGVGTGSITDCLSSIKKHVFEDKTLTMDKMLDVLKSNFEGAESIRQMFLNNTSKFGNDDDYADDLMKEVFDIFYDAVNGRPSMKGGKYRIDMLPTTCHVYFGSVVGATPDGRLGGQPLSEGISPAQGADRLGPTAVIKSAAKMDHLRTGGTLLNQKFTPKLLEGQEGIDNLAHLVRSYFKMDGHHIQFNVVSADTLKDAQTHPENYKDLIVRVAGYSDYFCDLTKELQDEIITRTEQTNF